MRGVVFLSAVLLLLSTGCGSRPEVPAAVLTDWCVEHRVPESKCTLCHPDLIAGFQAANDWCSEHGLPESVCPICHPDVVPANAPPAPSEDPEAPTAVLTDWCVEHRVPESKCTICHPDLIPGFQAANDWCAEHGLPESVCPICHPDRVPANAPPAPAEDPEAPPADKLKVRLDSPTAAAVAGIETEPVQRTAGSDSFSAPAKLVYDASRRAEVNARRAGVVREVLVDVGSFVRKGAPLVVLDSPEVGADRSRLAAARARVETASAQLERDRALYGQGIVPRRDLQESESALAEARAEVDALEAAGGVVGAGGTSGRYTLVAPITGVVVRREGTVGRQVDTEEMLVEVVDPSVLWAEIDVPEPRLAGVVTGLEITLTFDAIPGRTFGGRVFSVSPEVDPRTRTAVARVRLDNADGALRANMYGRATIAAGGAGTAVVVPRAALQRANGVDVVFVRISDLLYETRHVEARTRDDGSVEIARGVEPGERVVTVGSFLLKTETLKGSIGAGCCDVE
jgi:cobalt-zinc-cadmium efflux system membrane fusion protein